MSRQLTVLAALIAMAVACSGDAPGSEADAPTDTPDGSGTTDADTTDADTTGPPPLTIPEFDTTAIDIPYCDVDEEAIDVLLDALTLRQRIGQHVVAGVARNGDGVASDGRVLLTEYAIGGIFSGPGAGISLEDPRVTGRFVRAAQAHAVETTGIPLWVALDQEGGPNAVINSVTGGTDTIGSLPLGATLDPQAVFAEFDVMGREIHALGFNMDFGPVLDTLRSTRNGNLNTRSFGPNPELNAVLGTAAVLALQRNLVLPTGKHFAGDGLSDGNPHVDHVYVDVPRDVLDDVLLRPFRAAIDAGLDGIMTMPAAFPAVDPDRAALTSRAVTTDLLRGELGFEGLVITDALGMAGVEIGLAQDAVPGLEALKAGADLLLYVTPETTTLDALYTAVEAALESGELDPGEFDASTRSIVRMKQRYCLFDGGGVDPEQLPEVLARPEDRAIVAEHARGAVVVLENDGILPLEQGTQVVYVGPGEVFRDAGSGWLNVVDQTFGHALAAAGATVSEVLWPIVEVPSLTFDQATRRIASEDPDVIVLGTLQGRFSFEQQQLVEWIVDSVDVPIVHVILGVPFDYFQTRGRVAAAVALMGSRGPMVEAGAAVLMGTAEPGGRMLYDLGQEGGAVQVGDPIPVEEPGRDRCTELDVDCSGQGLCVDTGADYGCVCNPNWHPSRDGHDCEPDGTGD